jgi:type VI secretion system protein ImpJ
MYYLQVKTGESSGKIIDMAEHVVKLGCDEEIGVLMKRALPGVHLEPLRDPAPGLARRPDVLYFKVDSSSRYWYDIQKSYGICLYWKDAPEDMAADLIIIKQ